MKTQTITGTVGRGVVKSYNAAKDEFGTRPILTLTNDVYTDLQFEVRGCEPLDTVVQWEYLVGRRITVQGVMSFGLFIIHNFVFEESA